MGNLQVVGKVKKLNNQNYTTLQTCMESYLQRQDLWEIVGGSDVIPPKEAGAMKKWRIKAGKAMFVIKTTIEEELLEHIMLTGLKIEEDYTKYYENILAYIYIFVPYIELPYLDYL